MIYPPATVPILPTPLGLGFAVIIISSSYSYSYPSIIIYHLPTINLSPLPPHSYQPSNPTQQSTTNNISRMISLGLRPQVVSVGDDGPRVAHSKKRSMRHQLHPDLISVIYSESNKYNLDSHGNFEIRGSTRLRMSVMTINAFFMLTPVIRGSSDTIGPLLNI